ncbi:MAG: tetratricopeptide repeat protein, partial [Flavobacteriaceae bacterium]|nr:tetratricopeptide repeat protein [Flavobacteriaceae bacterium]
MKYLTHIIKRAFASRIIFLLLLFNTVISYSQNNSDERLVKYIESGLEKVDEFILERRFDFALARIEQLEIYSGYFKNEFKRISLDLKKAKTLYGLQRENEAIDILLNNLVILSARNENNSLFGKYVKFLGEIFFTSENYDRAIHYYNTGLDFYSPKGNSLEQIDFNILMAKAYFRKEMLDSSKIYYSEAVKFQPNNTNMGSISLALSALSGIAVLEDDYDSARQFGERSLEIEEKRNDTVGMARALFNLSGIYYRKGEFETAKTLYQESLMSVKKSKSSGAIQIKENALYNLSYVHEELGDFKSAYFYLLDATELSDSISQAAGAQNISEIEAKYNVEKQAAETEREKRKRAQAQALFYGTALAFLAILALGYIFYRNYRLKQQAKLDHIEHESQTKIINATIDAKEKERKAIAETLHDSVSALLSSANLHLQATKAQLKKKSPQEITKAQTIVNEASVKIRDLSHELISSVLLKFGLAFAVHDMCQKYSNSELTLHSDDDGIKRYHQDFEIKIHNIIE